MPQVVFMSPWTHLNTSFGFFKVFLHSSRNLFGCAIPSNRPYTSWCLSLFSFQWAWLPLVWVTTSIYYHGSEFNASIILDFFRNLFECLPPRLAGTILYHLILYWSSLLAWIFGIIFNHKRAPLAGYYQRFRRSDDWALSPIFLQYIHNASVRSQVTDLVLPYGII